jgi:glycosyltransferase involved in cell wall biosynthesis
MLTVHLLTKNNSKTIRKALDSVQWADKIMIADLGSIDNTIQICKEADVQIFQMNCPRNQARNTLIEKTSGPTLYLEPWEAFANGHNTLSQLSGNTYATILQNKSLTKDIRAWINKPSFINPVYEAIEGDAVNSDILIYSTGRTDHKDLLQEIYEWKKAVPLSIAPYYYEACTLLSLGLWNQFLTVSEHYMFLDKTKSMSAVMNHYYFATAQLMYVKKVRPTLQNLSICLDANPLMAEFWCLAGDVHYHLTKKFNVAKDLYENAVFMGSKRLKNDKWPMDISKYKIYPLKMIESCNKIMESKSLYVNKDLQDGL